MTTYHHSDSASPLPVPPEKSEAERLAARCGRDVVRLDGNWKKVLKEMPKLGPVRCHTENRAIIHNRFGPYRWVRFIFDAGQTGGPEVDLRLFMQNWRFGFAVSEPNGDRVKRSLQFFGKYGDPIHTIFLVEGSHVPAFDAIATAYRSPDQGRSLAVEPRRVKPEIPDDEIDVEAFRARWRKMWDTHQFFRLHRRFGLSRIQALRLAPPELVRPLPRHAGRELFERAARKGVGFMTFSGNRGCLQIHSGPASNFSNAGEWFQVRERDFHLDVHEPSIAHAYEVRKPTFFGNVTSVELFDEEGSNVAVFYGKRGRLEREHTDWRELVEELPGMGG
ncbi:MAG TPA: ChuX/HutX family heme-like substrate-binding protein [Chthoniobacteraceae bacterium]|nr:ChuX/HutX family heme-like substrate-binding protein [Chthoniobacteraceae bacterium]